jgi:hypothetical protein
MGVALSVMRKICTRQSSSHRDTNPQLMKIVWPVIRCASGDTQEPDQGNNVTILPIRPATLALVNHATDSGVSAR